MHSLINKSTHWIVPAVIALVLAGGWVKASGWVSDAHFHTVLEMIATVFGIITASVSLVLYQARREGLFLVFGAGFLGIALLDGYHTLMTAPWMAQAFSDFASVTVWSWLASRLMLSLLFLYIAYHCLVGKRLGGNGMRTIFLGVTLATVTILALATLLPLPNPLVPEYYFSRPAELLPGLLFLFAALMLYRSGQWRERAMYYWLLSALVLNMVAQLEYMAASKALYDGSFDVGHALKLLGYLALLVGLLQEVLNTYRRAVIDTAETVRRDEYQKWDRTVRQQEQTYKSIVDSMPQAIYLKDLDGNYLQCNKNFADFLEMQREAIIGRSEREIDNGKFVSFCRVDEQKAILSGEPVRRERLNYLGQNNRWYESLHLPLLDDHGQPQGVIGFIWDIDDEKHRETELKIRDAAIAESINAIALCNLDGDITYINQSMRVLLRYSDSNALLGKSLSRLMPNQRGEYDELLRQLFSERRWQGELKLMRDGGHPFYAQLSAALLNDSEGQPHGFMISLIDITEQRRAMEALMRSEETFNKAQEIAHIGSWDWDMENNALAWSDEIYRIFGLQPREFAATYEAFLACVHPDDRNVVTDAVNASIADPQMAYSVEHRVVWRDGQERIVHEQGKVYRDSEGTPVRMIGTVLDITERKRVEQELERHRKDLESLVEERTRELEQAHEELIRSERLATLGKLTAMVSHELRNPLGAMKPSLYLISKKVRDDEKLSKALERLDRNISRCDHIIDELLDFTRASKLSASRVSLDSWIGELLSEQNIPVGIELVEDLHLSEVKVEIDTERLRRAIINVVENACQAMHDKPDQPHRLRINTAEANNRFEIRLSDTGGGIPSAVMDKVFEPLFSTKGFGVGLGMPTVKQIMEQHGGGVEIDTVEGVGTTVTLWLPHSIVKEAGAAA